jgi:phosphoribosylanthranilate isomerase
VKTPVKICGIKRVRDARLAVKLGASMIGVVMVKDSKRRATPAQAAAVVRAVGKEVPVVLVFRDAGEAEVVDAAKRTGAKTVQILDAPEKLYSRLEKRGLRVIRARQVPAGANKLPRLSPAPRVDRLYLLDSGTGGTGTTFNWKAIGRKAPRHVLIAGGVNPDNVGELMKLKPYGIDLASGVESAPGVKDAAKLRALFAAIGGAS